MAITIFMILTQLGIAPVIDTATGRSTSSSPLRGVFKTFYNTPGVPWPDWVRHSGDGLTVLTAAAAVTSTVWPSTSVLVAPLHVPAELARTLATLDLISRGRVIAGFGTGWSIDEYNATGADLASRGRALEARQDTESGPRVNASACSAGNRVIVVSSWTASVVRFAA